MLGENLRVERARRNWTQGQLAKAAGVRQGTLRGIEYGTTKGPRLDTLEALAKALDVDVGDLIKTSEGSK